MMMTMKTYLVEMLAKVVCVVMLHTETVGVNIIHCKVSRNISISITSTYQELISIIIDVTFNIIYQEIMDENV